MPVTVFVNIEATSLETLFFNQNYEIKKLYENIFTLNVENEETNWIIKTYKDTDLATHEHERLKKLSDIKGIPEIVAVTSNNSFNAIILSRLPGIDLTEWLYKHDHLTEYELKIITRKILTILKKIHDAGIIHGDIKPENILYCEQTKEVSIIDFEGEKHTTEYASPEFFNNKELTNKIDMWSLGVTLYNSLSGYMLFTNKTEVLQKVIKYSSNWSYSLRNFLSCLLEYNPELRYNCDDALRHEWLQ